MQRHPAHNAYLDAEIQKAKEIVEGTAEYGVTREREKQAEMMEMVANLETIFELVSRIKERGYFVTRSEGQFLECILNPERGGSSISVMEALERAVENMRARHTQRIPSQSTDAPASLGQENSIDRRH